MTTALLWIGGYFAVALPAASVLGRMIGRAAQDQTFDIDHFYATVLSTPLPQDETS